MSTHSVTSNLQTWQPIETAPLDKAVIVACRGAPDVRPWAVREAQYFEGDGWYWAGNDPTDAWGGSIVPERWMPLPEPPND